MDFEFALWQAVYLIVNPQVVYRNFHYRKQTKNQYARDDPAFLVLLASTFAVTTISFGVMVHLPILDMIYLCLWFVGVDCIGLGMLVRFLCFMYSYN